MVSGTRAGWLGVATAMDSV